MTIKAPEQVGFSAARLKRISALMQGYVDRNELAGISAAVARQGQVVYDELFGWMEVKTQAPMRRDAIFRLASMSKPVTTAALMMLYEEGHFHLNTPVSKFIPGFANMKVYAGGDGETLQLADLERPVTMRHLLTHTSGLVYGANPEDPVDKLWIDRQKTLEQQGAQITSQSFIEEILKLPLAFQPGTKWRYGANIEVLGGIIEIISGKSLAEFMEERIFKPLGMVDTAFYVPPEKCERVPELYRHIPDKDGLKKLPGGYPTTLPSFQSGGGGLFSTLADYSRFLQMLVNGGELRGTHLLSPRTVALYSMNHAPLAALPYGVTPKEDLYHWGYGFSLGTRVLMDVSQSGMYGSVGEFGWDGAFDTYFWVDPRLEMYGIMMIQHYPNAYYPVAQQFKQLTYQSLIV